MMQQALKNGLKKIKEEQAKLRRELVDKTITYIVGALSLVAGLAWNDAVKSAIEYFFPFKSGSISVKMIYAFFVTVVVVSVSVYLLRISQNNAEKNS